MIKLLFQCMKEPNAFNIFISIISCKTYLEKPNVICATTVSISNRKVRHFLILIIKITKEVGSIFYNAIFIKNIKIKEN